MRNIKFLLIILIVFCVSTVGCAETELKTPTGKMLYKNLLVKIKIIYFSNEEIHKGVFATFSTKDRDEFIKMLREVTNTSWNDITSQNSIEVSTLPYDFSLDDGTGKQYGIEGNSNGDLIFNYDLIYPGISDKWVKENNMHYLRKYTNVKFKVDKEKLEALIKPYKAELLKK